MAFMLDNATNNDTFVNGIASCCRKENIPFNSTWARLCCISHTIHLAALKVCYHICHFDLFYTNFCVSQLLEAIGAVSPLDGKKAASRGGNYQDNVVLPLSDDADEIAERQDEEYYEESTDENESVVETDRVVTAVDKVSGFYVHSESI